MLTDRAAVLGELVRAHVAPGRLAMLWLWGSICALGWLLVGTALMTFEESYDVISAGIGVIIAAMGVGCMVPAVVLVVVGLRRDRRIHAAARRLGRVGPRSGTRRGAADAGQPAPPGW